MVITNVNIGYGYHLWLTWTLDIETTIINFVCFVAILSYCHLLLLFCSIRITGKIVNLNYPIGEVEL